MKIELIPVIEIGFEEEESQYIQPYPDNLYWLNSSAWDEYFTQKVEKNGYKAYERIKEGYPFYRISQFNSKKDLLKIVFLHLGGLNEEDRSPLEESCALFGGYVLKLEGQIIFTPQCCGTLADFESWKSTIQDEFQEGYICKEGHPCPKVERINEELEFTFEDELEGFIPPAIKSKVGRGEMIKAIEKCQIELDEFGRYLNLLEEELNQKRIADILIYEKE